jgi:CheY-like chemotaxis protein
VEQLATQGDVAGATTDLDLAPTDLDRFLATLPRIEEAPAPGTRRRRIGIVEDNDDTRLIVRTILESSYEVDECATGGEALARFARRQPDAILMDISLPGIDGIEVLARLRADPVTARIPVVALTAHAMVGDRERFLAQGFDGYASKPILEEQDLLDAVRAALDRGAP